MKELIFAIALLMIVGCSNDTSSLVQEKEEILYISQEFLTEDSNERSLALEDPPFWGYLSESGSIFFNEQLASERYKKELREYSKARLEQDPSISLLESFMEYSLKAKFLVVYTSGGDTISLTGQEVINYRASLTQKVREGFKK